MASAKVLIVDDSMTVVTVQKVMLRGDGYEIATAPNGKAALAAIAASPPDLVLMDVVMPEMNGIDCCREIKSNPETRSIAVIMVTTKGDMPMVTAAYTAGCDDFVTKPIDQGELRRKIEKLLARRGATSS